MKDTHRGVEVQRPTWVHEGGRSNGRDICPSCLAVRKIDGEMAHADRCVAFVPVPPRLP